MQKKWKIVTYSNNCPHRDTFFGEHMPTCDEQDGLQPPCKKSKCPLVFKTQNKKFLGLPIKQFNWEDLVNRTVKIISSHDENNMLLIAQDIKSNEYFVLQEKIKDERK